MAAKLLSNVVYRPHLTLFPAALFWRRKYNRQLRRAFLFRSRCLALGQSIFQSKDEHEIGSARP
ncbi:MAG TPA: hypothetical protein VIN93_13060, partial [Bryobacteraceae bacterium]